MGSPEALAREVLAAIARNDRVRLEELALSEEEFKTVVWPELPSSRPDVGLPVDYAWRDLTTKSRADLARTLASFGGRKLELVGIGFRGESTEYRNLRVRRMSQLDVRAPSGETARIRVFGSAIELNGRVKVFSYVVD